MSGEVSPLHQISKDRPPVWSVTAKLDIQNGRVRIDSFTTAV
jgi:hypothetical protein